MLAGVWQNIKVETSRGADAIQLADAWRELGRNAVEPAAFQSADFALPILAHQGGVNLIRVSLGSAIAMALPVERRWGMQASAASTLTASGLPQTAEHGAEAAIMALLNSLSEPYLFRSLPKASAFFALLENAQPQLHVVKSWKRAALKINGTFEQWFGENFDHKRRKEFKRLRARLAEQGKLELETLNQSSSLHGFINSLVELEAKGWKGKRGTALNSDKATEICFSEICTNCHRSGTLRFWTLKFNGQPIASLVGLVDGAQGWIVKIAYDESFAKFSPGVLLILDATEALFTEPALKLVDSCAIPGHPMIERIWRDRIEMVDVLVAPAKVSPFRFAATVTALKTHAKLRQSGKSIFYRLTKRKRS